ncbi:alpha/beta fold hydrolase [uncultured Tateyamaria sp.]|uniref:alpha/beta fold hydrolase n=1 Tax=uncultured Tateyamaria sp. TaxID=455651 RepID=UPI00262170FD|nr:alpha/beta hydrolase [uncultured Tateyamaria sp.]
MMWVVLILLGIVAVPLTIEWTRKGISEKDRSRATGQFALLSQGTTHFEWLGPERGPVALCIHGLTTPSFVWRGMAKGLALMGFRVLVYDLYGRGLSERVRGKQDAAFFVQQITDLLAHENVKGHLTVFGYSMGGAIAAHFTAQHPGSVKQLVLLAPAGMFDLGGGKLRTARDVPLIGDWLFLLIYPFMLRQGIRAEAHLPSSVPDIAALQAAETDRRGFFPAVLASVRGILRDTTEEQQRAVAAAGVPVLAIWAEEDGVIPVSGKDMLAQWIPQAMQVVVPEATHSITYTHTDQVLEVFRTSRG